MILTRSHGQVRGGRSSGGHAGGRGSAELRVVGSAVIHTRLPTCLVISSPFRKKVNEADLKFSPVRQSNMQQGAAAREGIQDVR